MTEREHAAVQRVIELLDEKIAMKKEIDRLQKRVDELEATHTITLKQGLRPKPVFFLPDED